MRPPPHDACTSLYPALHRYLKARMAESSLISTERRKKLESVSAYASAKVGSGEPVRLTFICTHNSRRSQIAQIWAQTMARFLGVPGISAFSGGTEVSAFDPRAVSALVRAGFRIERSSTGENPVYLVHQGAELPPVRAFSKTFLDPANPPDRFCAVLACSDADRNCPAVSGADERVLLPYSDPRSSDGTGREMDIYDERCREISREMGWLFARVGIA